MSGSLLVGSGILAEASWAERLPEGHAFLVSEPGAWRRLGRRASSGLSRAGRKPVSYLLPSGEAAKSWSAVSGLLSFLLRHGADRGSSVAALGGGAVTDAAGFAASIYMRGIPWASLPTTLLGQLDGGLGGKTAINLPQGKNLVGTFHQPSVVVCDVDALRTLSRRDLVSGLAEALKYGLVFDPPLWRTLVARWDSLLDGQGLEGVVRKGASWKLAVVSQDERERGRRELLNFGHTLGHALERAAGYGRLRHGEAVIWGMRAAVLLSRRLAGLSRAQAEEIESFLSEMTKLNLRGIPPRAILKAARSDKKARGGKLRFVLLRSIGKTVRGVSVADGEVLAAVRALL